MPTAVQLARAHPEWRPWLALIEAVRSALEGDRWQAHVPPVAADSRRPLLAAAPLACAPEPVAALFEDLQATARRAGVAGWEHFRGKPLRQAEALVVFRAALVGDDAHLSRLAGVVGIEPNAFATVAALLPVPFLHACRRRWTAALPAAWGKGYCPCCGAWPTFAEVCGIERRRYLRCGRCAVSWEVHCLQCPYCGANDHAALASLQVAQDARSLSVEVCNLCRGYLKVFHTLAPAVAAEVMLVDLSSVELDVVAANRDYARPKGLGYCFAPEDTTA